MFVVYLVASLVAAVCSLSHDLKGEYSYETDRTYWHNVARAEMEHAAREPPKGVAKNIILFLGDGMGPTTVTAARILHGQLQGKSGEEVKLSFDKFPYTGLSRTYAVNAQVTDSAASATAYLCGVKTNQGTLGVDANVVRQKCDSVDGNEVDSILQWAHRAGKSTGIVTTTRITHATPAGAYSHCPDRDWESDSKMPKSESACKDIAAQLIDNNKHINVILGGGRACFYPKDYVDSAADHEAETSRFRRSDRRYLIADWENQKRRDNQSFRYVYDRDGLEAVDALNTDYLLGLFSQDHLDFEQLRNTSKEPSIAEMTAKAIQMLRKNENGFFLLVEGGRIDHAHHFTKPSLALHDTIAFAAAVERATQLTSKTDTLIVVTADHSHTMAIAGYPDRGNPILGLSVEKGKYSDPWGGDGMPFTTIQYSNGPGYTSPRENLTGVDTESPTFVSQSGLNVTYETHGGEDVAIYALGPYSHLYTGVHEQNYIPMVMAYAACIGPFAEGTSSKCAKHDLPTYSTKTDTTICDSGAGLAASVSVVFLNVLVYTFWKEQWSLL